ncbi:MipA/OmpV family protein [Piscinibacter terrae]|uniref:MipA/OmpV family protein n=1 Tax=Piscinibacter terrae TaxID=2496871 RepID=A0A3N7JIS0_9BURK|nr:MipA/OmpV family protein [Albitalea terrae]RQP21339.1 MipA/OmpV family protein [Albitalea terrae]
MTTLNMRTFAAIALALTATSPSLVHAEDKAETPSDTPAYGWTRAVIGGIASRPDFEGSRTSHTELVLGGMASYRTREHGTFGLGNHGLGWSVDSQDTSFGIALSGDAGRVDSDDRSSGLAGKRPGSARLAGMGTIASTPVLAVFGSVKLGGLPLSASLRQATGSHKGTLLDLATAIPWRVNPRTTLSLSPSLTWADSRYNQAYFGVTAEQAARTGFKAYNAGAGLKGAELAFGAEVELAKNWQLQGQVKVERLMGDAARSPIVERKTQVGTGLVVAYRF